MHIPAFSSTLIRWTLKAGGKTTRATARPFPIQFLRICMNLRPSNSQSCLSEWKIDARNGMGTTYKGPSNLTIPPKACPCSQIVHPLDTMSQVVCIHDGGRHDERLSICVRRRNQTIGVTGDSRKVTTVSEDKRARLASPLQVDHTT